MATVVSRPRRRRSQSAPQSTCVLLMLEARHRLRHIGWQITHMPTSFSLSGLCFPPFKRLARRVSAPSSSNRGPSDAAWSRSALICVHQICSRNVKLKGDLPRRQRAPTAPQSTTTSYLGSPPELDETFARSSNVGSFP